VIVRWAVVGGSLAAGLGTLALLWRLWRYREQPGAAWFLASLSAQAVWCLAYGVALVTSFPGIRLGLEVVTLVAMPLVAVLYLGFALAYTGRSDLVETWLYRLPLASAAASTLLVATTPLHGLVFAEFDVTTVAGLAGASYSHEPGLFAVFALAALWTVIGVVLLFDTVLSYGPLFRGEALAVGASAAAPGIVLTLWVFGVGPEGLNLTPLAFLPHVALDGYAFVRGEMFEFLPGTRRAGERAAIEDLGSPVAVVDTGGRVVILNDAAEALAGCPEGTALTRSLSVLLDAEIALDGGEQRRTIETGGQRREFVVTPARLTDPGDTHVGYTVLFQDVTDAVRREQRLTVLNRVLRHNLRNDLNVVQGYLEAGADRVADESVSEMLSTAAGTATDLARTGEKVREIEETMGSPPDPDGFELAPLVAVAADDCRRQFDRPVDVDVPEDLAVRADRETLSVVLVEAVENALEHTDGPVAVRARRADREVVLTIADEGPGVPDHELETLREGTETPLVHGSGVGLWVIQWGVARLGGTVTFETSGGTTVELTLPAADRRAVARD